MKIVGWLSGVWLASLAGAFGQVTVEVVLEQEQFLPGESLPVAVRITNHSGQTLRLGGENEWLSFAVESRDGFVVARTGEPPVQGEFALESSKRAIKRVDLAPYFNLAREGRYTARATVKIPQWEVQYASDPQPFDIIRGARLWEREFGVPQAATTNAPPELRKYILQQANYLKNQLKLYLRLTDASESRIFRVLALGPMVSFGRPEPQVDRQSNLHVLYQYGKTTFNYTVINPDGEVLLRQTYGVGATRPRLQVDADGRFGVTGGVRRVTADDVPAPKPAAADGKAARP